MLHVYIHAAVPQDEETKDRWAVKAYTPSGLRRKGRPVV